MLQDAAGGYLVTTRGSRVHVATGLTSDGGRRELPVSTGLLLTSDVTNDVSDKSGTVTSVRVTGLLRQS